MTPASPRVDQPQPLPAHLVELQRGMLGPLLLFGSIMIATFSWSDDILQAMLGYHSLADSVNLYTPAEFLRVRLSLAALAGCLSALPLLLLQFYRFAHAGLTDSERSFARRTIPLSIVLLAGGTVLGWTVFLPKLLPLLTDGPAEAQFSLAQTIGLLLSLSLGTGIALQLPLLAFMARHANVWDGGIVHGRRLAWALLLALALIVTPDPATIGLLLTTVLLVLLFETGVWLARGARG